MKETTHQDILNGLYDRGYAVRVREDGKLAVSPSTGLTDADRAALTEHKAALVAILTAPPPPLPEWVRKINDYNAAVAERHAQPTNPTTSGQVADRKRTVQEKGLFDEAR